MHLIMIVSRCTSFGACLGGQAWYGGVAEWTKAAALKAVEGLVSSVGSNPTPSAKPRLLEPALQSKVPEIQYHTPSSQSFVILSNPPI